MHHDCFVDQLLDVEDSRSLILMDSFYAVKEAREPEPADSLLSPHRASRKKYEFCPTNAIDRQICMDRRQTSGATHCSLPKAPARTSESFGKLPTVGVMADKASWKSPKEVEERCPEVCRAGRKALAPRPILETDRQPLGPAFLASAARVHPSKHRGFVERQKSSRSELSPNEIILKRFGERSSKASVSKENQANLAHTHFSGLDRFLQLPVQRAQASRVQQLADFFPTSSRQFEASPDTCRSPKQPSSKPHRLRNADLNRLLKGISYFPVRGERFVNQKSQPAFSICLRQTQSPVLKPYSKKWASRADRGAEEPPAKQLAFYLKGCIGPKKEPQAFAASPGLKKEVSVPAKSFRLPATSTSYSNIFLERNMRKPRPSDNRN